MIHRFARRPGRHLACLIAPLLLAACASDGGGRPAVVASSPPPAPPASGLERVMKQTAPMLANLLGPSALDTHEGPARKLQWRGPACVLDAYLYPPEGGGEPRVTWIDARTPVGIDMDRASCIAALARTPAARR